MIEHLGYVESSQFNPYANLALEEYLLNQCKINQCILYLWQNEHTVVIGKNQNAWKECNVSKLEEDKGYLARRISGGGAVYHDLGNLNFTFLVNKENYDVARQMRVIKRAVEKFGLTAEVSGRNDITIDGRKFSGNAFCEQGEHCYHHGTLMINVKVDELSKYLTVSKVKLQAKGVDSVKSRVGNLNDFCKEITVETLKKALRESFEEEYGLKTERLEFDRSVEKEIEQIRVRLQSWDWLFGRKMDFHYELEHKFDWGLVSMEIQVNEGKITDIMVYSDALYPNVLEEIPKYLKGIRCNKKAMYVELGLFWSEDELENKMMKDVIEWLKTIDL